ncbi:hypothetical protein HPB47_007849 [Ixodes persulcatus]|uniref:Uncharacterized protein n=1 Tax=Ixodes persulcatus TaxID=34615 RepID=A0AC60P757_IXOPE|nr:hypothetical protein HPB47_007849 [Ixodes persulcatus]
MAVATREQRNLATLMNYIKRDEEKEKQACSPETDAAKEKSQWKTFRTTIKDKDRAYGIIIRTKGLDLKTIAIGEITAAIATATGVSPRDVIGTDLVTKNTMNNMITIRTNDKQRAQKYLGITTLKYQGTEVVTQAYTANRKESVRIVVSKCLPISIPFTDQEINEQLKLENLKIPISDAKRMGRTTSILVTLDTTELPGFIQACTSCREMGHRADTCPYGLSQICPNCGEEHNFPRKIPGMSTEYTCTPRCVICGGSHYTGGKKCKDRYKPLPEPRSPKKSTPERDRETAKIDMEKKNFPELSHLTTAGEDSEEELSYAQTLRKKKGASKKKQDSNPRIKELEKKFEDLLQKERHGSNPLVTEPPNEQTTVQEVEMAPPPYLPSVRPRKRTDSESTVNSEQTSDKTKTSRPGKVSRKEEPNQNVILAGLAWLEAMLNEIKRRMDNHDKHSRTGGLCARVNLLKMLIMNTETPPDIIAVQESGDKCSLPRYARFDAEVRPTGKNDSYFLDLDESVKAIVTEIIPKKKKHKNLFICNVDSNPKDTTSACAKVFAETSHVAGENPTLLLGDCNAHSTTWGYDRDTPKGREIANQAELHEAFLLNEVADYTRIGNSAQKDTNPDLTFGINIDDYTWLNTRENLGSDHYVIETRFRQKRKDRPLHTIEEWCAQLVEDHESVTTEIENPTQARTMDRRLQHMLEAYGSIYRRRRNTGKRYHKLRKRAAKLSKEIEEYAQKLNQQQWQQMCDELQGRLHTKSPWTLFRRMLAPEDTKLEKRKLLAKPVRDLKDEVIYNKLRTPYLESPPSTTEIPAEYEGAINNKLDAPITESEVRKAMAGVKKTFAPGQDKITNRMLRNLDDNSLWTSGNLPSSFRHATVCFIPKPGKPLMLENLRPISLTSCVGKLLERMIQVRVQEYMEENNLFTHQMFGFSRHLSKQDKAFDCILHAAILRQISELGLGKRTYNYVRSFLSDRTANIQLEGDASETFPVNVGSGTPQGAVISPLLFNIAMLPMSRKLKQVAGLQHAIYADDITIWTAHHSPYMGKVMKTGVEIVKEEAAKMGLEHATEKSALLVRPPSQRALREEMEFYLKLQKIDVPRAEKVRILGMTVTIKREQSTSLVRRVTRKSYGLKENGTCRPVQAFVLSSIMYAAPKAFKIALGIPVSTSTEAMEQLEIYNSFEKMRSAQKQSQVLRLSRTETGRRTYQRIKECEQHVLTSRIPPLPKNMDTERNKDRREARAKALDKLHGDREHVYHADAGPCPGTWNKYVIAVCSTNDKTTASATITSDSRTAISNFGDGKVGKAARKILQKKTPQTGSRFSLTWVAGHSGHLGNEEAHALVAPTTDGDHCYGASPYDRGPRAYNDILRSIRMQRKFMGAPHKRLSRTQESTWRRLQLHNTLTPRMLSRIWPHLFSDKCEECGSVGGSWAHTYWIGLDDQDKNLPWCVLLVAEDYETQLAVILRTLEIEHRLKTRLSERRSLPYSPP